MLYCIALQQAVSIAYVEDYFYGEYVTLLLLFYKQITNYKHLITKFTRILINIKKILNKYNFITKYKNNKAETL